MHTTLITLTPSYKGNTVNFILAILLATFLGPCIIFMMVHTAISNNVTGLLSWSLLCVSSLLFILLSYSKFKYIYYTYFKEHTAEIDYGKKSIFILPYKETISLEKVTAFVYSKRFKKYYFRYENLPVTSIEAKRNTTFEHALLDFSLECKEE
jgi:hypothetical protein